jgi:hypothetical protein
MCRSSLTPMHFAGVLEPISLWPETPISSRDSYKQSPRIHQTIPPHPVYGDAGLTFAFAPVLPFTSSRTSALVCYLHPLLLTPGPCTIP